MTIVETITVITAPELAEGDAMCAPANELATDSK